VSETLPAAIDQGTALQATSIVTPMHMIQLALQQGNLDKLAQFMDLQERHEKNEARKAYVAAIAVFKQNPPTVTKSKQVSFRNKTGGLTEYVHATLADVVAAATKGLADVGISHRWDVAQQPGSVKVTCILTHRDGHSEEVSMHSGIDDSGGKNAIQAIGSAVTYLQRYTLMAATGMAAQEQDDDGKVGGLGETPATLTEEQRANMQTALQDAGADRATFLAWISSRQGTPVTQLSEVYQIHYVECMKAIAAKARAA
jgi:hypothetical protein